MPTDTRAAACLGKLPTHGDFVNHRASTPTMRTFDEWVRKGLYQARQHSDGRWKTAYDRGATTHFLFCGRGQQAPNALLGVLRPSRDQTGRTYPFIVTCEVPKRHLSSRHLAYLPVQAGTFYAEANRIVRAATDGDIPYREVADQVEHIDTAFSIEPTAPRAYKRYLQQKTMGPFLEELFGHFSDSGKYRLFNNLLEILLPQRERSHPQLNYGLQFPLESDDDTLTHVACFWLEASLRLLGYPSVEPTFFWTDRDPPHAAPFLILFLGAPRPHAFFHLLASDEEHESVYPLARVGNQNNAEAALAIPEEYGPLLEDEQLRLWDFLRSL